MLQGSVGKLRADEGCVTDFVTLVTMLTVGEWFVASVWILRPGEGDPVVEDMLTRRPGGLGLFGASGSRPDFVARPSTPNGPPSVVDACNNYRPHPGRLGVEQDAYFIVDSMGNRVFRRRVESNLRDLARFGEMIRMGGSYNGQQIVPTVVIDGIRQGGNQALFAPAGYKTLPGWSYRDMWWVSHNSHGAFTARGIHGQAIYIDPEGRDGGSTLCLAPQG